MTNIEEYLRFLYGEPIAKSIYPKILDLARKPDVPSSQKRKGMRNGLALSQRDALLITYGDQVREPNAFPLQTLANFSESYLQGIVSGIHILPFYPYSSDDGFSVIDWFAVDPQLGTWEDVRKLAEKFDLMFDAVFNHMSAKSGWFQNFLRDEPEYRDFFIAVQGDPDLSLVVRPRALPLLTEFEGAEGPRKIWTTFSADQVDLNFKNPEVLLAALKALLFYVTHGARYIRLDAIAYLWKAIGTTCIHLPQTHCVVRLMRAVLDEIAPEVMLITETNVPHADNLSYLGDGTNEAQLVYNFALPPLVLHTLASGDASDLARWAASLRLPSGRTTFFNFLASHDGIGVNPVRGILSQTAIDSLVGRVQAHGGFVSYKNNADGSKSPYELNISFFDALSDPNNHQEAVETQVSRFMAAQAIMLALAGVPGIYFHSLFGSRNDRAAAESSGIPRRINRQKLAAAELISELSDPVSLRARVFRRYKELLEVRREQKAFDPRGSQEVFEAGKGVFAILRQASEGKECVVCLHNVTGEALQFQCPLRGNYAGSQWSDLLSKAHYTAGSDGVLSVELAPYQVLWARLADT